MASNNEPKAGKKYWILDMFDEYSKAKVVRLIKGSNGKITVWYKIRGINYQVSYYQVSLDKWHKLLGVEL